MRLKSLLAGDIRVQFKYGFYFLYIIFSVLYVALLFAFPEVWREKIAILMIFTDPAALGLFFMGAIVLFEKNDKVLDSIAVSPVKPYEYVVSKLFSLAIISTMAGLVIRSSAGMKGNLFYFMIGLFLSSCLFSSVGLIIACKITTLNQFIIATVPAEMLIFLPGIVWIFGFNPNYLLLHPAVCMIVLCTNGANAAWSMVILFVWTILFVKLASIVFKKTLQAVGGITL